MVAISFQQVCKTYQQQSILDQITLQVESGEFFGLVGVNGAGKTTLIKSLLDFCEINAGYIELFSVSHINPDSRLPLAFLPEQFVPPHYLTGTNFLNYLAKLHGQHYDSAQAKILCETLDFPVSALNKSVRTYSKGMGQKLGLVACFLSNRRLLVLDEPTSGLDPKARAFLKRYLLTLKAQGTTLFFSTHILADVQTLCDRMAILHAGRLQFVGSVAECCHQYETDDLEQAYLRCILPKIGRRYAV